MDMVYGLADRPREDLTARARIRDAALAQFAEQGFDGATIKGIADAAGVSTGLVQHHFGSKAGLRAACDEAVVEVFRRRLTQRDADGGLADPDVMAALRDASVPLLRYLARAAVDGSPAAAYVFDQLADGAEEFLTGHWPERFPTGSGQARDAASVMSAMHAGTIVLHEHLARRMGADPLARDHATRIGMAMFDLYAAMGEFVESVEGARIHEAVAGSTTAGRSTMGERDDDHD